MPLLRFGLTFMTMALVVGPLRAQAAPSPAAEGKLLKEVYEAAFLEGTQVGWIRGLYKQLITPQGKSVEASTEMELTLQRFGQTLRLFVVHANHETLEGKVRGFVVGQSLSRDQQVTRSGKVIDGKELILTTEITGSPPKEIKVPWNDRCLGLYAQERFFRDQRPAPNTKLDYIRFEPMFDTYLTVHVEVKEWEETTLLNKEKKRLLRVESRLDKVMNITLPAEVLWLDEQGEPVKREFDLPGLGLLRTYRCTRAQAMARGGQAPVDMGLSQLVRLDRSFSRPNETREVVYRVRLKGVEDVDKAFALDDRQSIRNRQGDQFELVVTGLATPPAAAPGQNQAPPAEYLRSNHFLRSEDEKVQELTRQAVREEQDPWRKALRIERWVQQNIRNKNLTEAFATADQVARKLEGDCSEHAVLAAAMCRAAGVPARTALGLVHVPRERAMGYHMWIEVWVAGRWYPLDPTLGQGRVGAAHVKITDSHWNDTQGFLPLLPLFRVLGKVQMEVVSFKYDR